MAPRHTRPLLAGSLVLAGVLTLGCNPIAVPYFLMFGLEPKIDPPCRLAAPDKNREVRVMVLASSALETRPEFLRVERELASLLVRQLEKGFLQNKERVSVLPVSRVEKFKDEHPNWQVLSAQEIGQHFGADYVIDLEIHALSLYEKGSFNTFYRGHAEISVAVIDVHKPGEEPIFKDEYVIDYPRTSGPIPADGGHSLQQFRQAFLNRVATDLSWYFTSHKVEDDFRRE
ncbi:MAG: hypothetical protein NZ700_07465 [Gemmataceae bacterium]|nr:hypothetical protein [Gemmataceae bacterium]MDW8266008.1 hypothetical protein [Gemmataceae bacterium]